MRRNVLLFFLVVFSFNVSDLIAADSTRVVLPVSRIVYQRDLDNAAVIPVRGYCPNNATAVEARLLAREEGQGVTTKWVSINIDKREGRFSGYITASAGWYDLEIVIKQRKKQIASTTVERVGIGEVFIAVGHSVAQGGDINLEGAQDDRVITVKANNKADEYNNFYLKTGDLQYLPGLIFSQASTDVALAPFGHNSYFWSKFAEYVAIKNNVPVLILNAAFGGTSLEHWAKSSRGEQFEHGFVKSAIRMPYINLYNALKKYGAVTGVRALLADQGQNDNQRKNADSIFYDYRDFVQQARKDVGYDQLTIVVNRQVPSIAPWIKNVQERMLREPNTFPGPDYDKDLVKDDKYDGIHLSEQGMRKAAVLWSDALTPEFFSTIKPWIPDFK